MTIRYLAFLTALCCAAADSCYGQSLAISLQQDRLYPSLIVTNEIRVIASSDLSHSPGSYTVLINGKPAPAVTVKAIRPSINGQTQAEIWSVVFFQLEGGLKTGDKLRITTQVSGMPVTSNEETVPKGISNVNLQLSPSFVQSEQLKNNQKSAVGQLGVLIDELALIPSVRSFRTYLKTDSTISSNAKDTSSNVNLALGLQRSLVRSWYIPFHLETKMVGDQVADNGSSISSAGITTLLPWAWSRRMLNNALLTAPVSPEFAFDTQFERRVRQDTASRRQFIDKNAFRVSAHSVWTPIQILKGDGKGDPVSLQIKGTGWYLPHQRYAGVLKDRLEGLLEVSLFVPISKLTLDGGGMTTADKGTKSQVQVKYSHGANEANGFKHFSQLSIGLAVSK